MSPLILLQGRSKFPTMSGLLLSLILIVIFIFFLILFVISVIGREKVSVAMSDIYHRMPLSKFLDPKSLNLSITVMERSSGTYNYYAQPWIVDIYMGMLISKVHDINTSRAYMNQTLIPLELGECENSQNGARLCLKDSLWNRANIQLETISEYTESKNLAIIVNSCSNISLLLRNITAYVCRPQEEIDDVLKNSFIGIGFDTNTLDTRNFLNPINTSSNIYMVGLVKGTTKFLEVKLQGARLQTDQGIIKEDIKEDEFITVHSKSLDVASSGGQNVLFVSTFGFDNVEKVYHRSYDTVYDVLAKLSGIWKFLCIVMTFVATPLAKLGYFEKLALVLEENCTEGSQPIELKPLIRHFKQINYRDRFIFVASFGMVKTKNIKCVEESRKILEKIFDLKNFFDIFQIKMKGFKYKEAEVFNEKKISNEAQVKLPQFNDVPLENMVKNKFSINDT